MDVTDASFQTEVIERSRSTPVVVDFWAEWCGPCRTLGPVLEREVAARDGGLVLAKVDVDANPQVADEYAIRSIPAVKGFRNGKVVREFVGVQSPQSVGTFLDSLLGPSEGERLLAELREHALVIGEVVLSSGRTAQYYVDARRAILRRPAFLKLAWDLSKVQPGTYLYQATLAGSSGKVQKYPIRKTQIT